MTLTQEVTEKLLRMIHSNDLKVGDLFPSENELCNQFQVSRHTIREAIRNLVQEGHLYRLQGRGTFIASRKVMVDAGRKMCFSSIAQDSGFSPSVRYLSSYFEDAIENEYIADKLQLTLGEILCIEFNRIVNGIPLTYTRSHLIKTRFPGLEEKLGDDLDLYQLLRNEYGISEIIKEPYSLEVSIPRRRDLLALQIPETLPVFVLKSLSRDETDNIVDYRISVSRSDMVKFTNLVLEYDNQIL